MKDVHRTFLKVLLFVIMASITAHNYSLIRGADCVLNVVFVGLAWFAFGASWLHRNWPAGSTATFHRVAPRLYLTATILTVAIPFLSLGAGVLLTKYAPQHIDGAIAGMVTMRTPPSVITVTPLPRATSPAVSACVTTGTGSYVAAGMSDAIAISPATPVLKKVLEDIDSELRLLPASVFAVVLLLLLFFLWVVEMASELNSPSATGTASTVPIVAPA